MDNLAIEQVAVEGAQSRSAEVTDNKQLVVRGFLLSLGGVAGYCYFTLGAPDADARLVLLSLSVVGLGFIVWLVGTIRYFNQAIDAGDPDAVL